MTSAVSEMMTDPDHRPRGGQRGLGLPRPLSPIGANGRWHPVAQPRDVDTHDLMLLAEVASGRTIPVIGQRLGISERTVRRRLRSICEELRVRTPIEAVAWAARRRLV